MKKHMKSLILMSAMLLIAHHCEAFKITSLWEHSNTKNNNTKTKVHPENSKVGAVEEEHNATSTEHNVHGQTVMKTLSCATTDNQTYLSERWLAGLREMSVHTSLYSVLPYVQLAVSKGAQMAQSRCSQTGATPCQPESDPTCVTCAKISLGGDLIPNQRYYCPSDAEWEENDSVLPSERSHCPWHYRLNMNSYRYPAYMAEAVCRCDSCRGFSDDASKGCELVIHNVPVLAAVDTPQGGTCVYEMQLLPLAVACACAMPHVISPKV